MRAGGLVKLDVVAEQDGYMADAAITVGVSPGSEPDQRLVDCARAAVRVAMTVARADSRVSEIGRAGRGGAGRLFIPGDEGDG
jgi:methionyl aminopeptidase